MKIWTLLQAALGAALVSLTVSASAAPAPDKEGPPPGGTYTQNEIVNRAADFFGTTTEGLARAVERVFSEKGSPNAYIAGVEPVALTRKTVVDKDELRALVAEVREQSYATTVDQLDYGITALAVPIRSPTGRTIAALNSSGYTGLLTAGDLVGGRLQELRASAGRLGQAIARYPILESIIGAR